MKTPTLEFGRTPPAPVRLQTSADSFDKIYEFFQNWHQKNLYASQLLQISERRPLEYPLFYPTQRGLESFNPRHSDFEILNDRNNAAETAALRWIGMLSFVDYMSKQSSEVAPAIPLLAQSLKMRALEREEFFEDLKIYKSLSKEDLDYFKARLKNDLTTAEKNFSDVQSILDGINSSISSIESRIRSRYYNGDDPGFDPVLQKRFERANRIYQSNVYYRGEEAIMQADYRTVMTYKNEVIAELEKRTQEIFELTLEKNKEQASLKNWQLELEKVISKKSLIAYQLKNINQEIYLYAKKLEMKFQEWGHSGSPFQIKVKEYVLFWRMLSLDKDYSWPTNTQEENRWNDWMKARSELKKECEKWILFKYEIEAQYRKNAARLTDNILLEENSNLRLQINSQYIKLRNAFLKFQYMNTENVNHILTSTALNF